MKRALLCGTTLAGVAALAGNAEASDGIKLEVGGFFNMVYQGVFDKKSEGRFGNHHSPDGFNHNAEIDFEGETTLDNGLTVGAHIELEGENSDDQIDQSFVYWQGGFGKFQIGSQDKAIANYCLLPPGATSNFSAYSPNAWGSNDPIGSNAACVDTEGDSQGIAYLTPTFGGFQLILSYTPSNNAEDYTEAASTATAQPPTPTAPRITVSAPMRPMSIPARIGASIGAAGVHGRLRSIMGPAMTVPARIIRPISTSPSTISSSAGCLNISSRAAATTMPMCSAAAPSPPIRR